VNINLNPLHNNYQGTRIPVVVTPFSAAGQCSQLVRHAAILPKGR
jgi:hypothetical protein